MALELESDTNDLKESRSLFQDERRAFNLARGRHRIYF